MTCKWEKTAKGYNTGCYHEISVRIRGAIYCPFCGGKILKSRKRMDNSYYRARRGELLPKFKEYYRQNAEDLKEYQKERYREKAKI